MTNSILFFTCFPEETLIKSVTMSERSEYTQRRPFEEMYGKLPDWAIVEAIERGIIRIEPLVPNWRETMGTVTIDFSLGSEIQVLRANRVTHFDVRQGIKEGDFEPIYVEDGESYILSPGDFVIAKTKQRLTLPDDVIGYMEGRSSLARLGVGVFVNAARFDPGWDNYPVLEMKGAAPVPVKLYVGDAICAFSFERIMERADRSYVTRGRYTNTEQFHSLIAEDKERYTIS